MKKNKVYIEPISEQFLPHQGSEGAAGMDLIAAEDSLILPGETKLIGTGIKTAIPKGYEIQIRPRSGLSLRTSLRIANSPGTIDSDYRDEIKVICENTYKFSDLRDALVINPKLITKLKDYNLSDMWTYLKNRLNNDQDLTIFDLNLVDELKKERIYLDQNGNPFGSIYIKEGERFAQMVLAKYYIPDFEIVPDIRKIGTDRGGGFGSTG